MEDYDPCPLTCLTGGLTPELVLYETNVLPDLPRTVLNRFRVGRKHMITQPNSQLRKEFTVHSRQTLFGHLPWWDAHYLTKQASPCWAAPIKTPVGLPVPHPNGPASGAQRISYVTFTKRNIAHSGQSVPLLHHSPQRHLYRLVHWWPKEPRLPVSVACTSCLTDSQIGHVTCLDQLRY